MRNPAHRRRRQLPPWTLQKVALGRASNAGGAGESNQRSRTRRRTGIRRYAWTTRAIECRCCRCQAQVGQAAAVLRAAQATLALAGLDRARYDALSRTGMSPPTCATGQHRVPDGRRRGRAARRGAARRDGMPLPQPARWTLPGARRTTHRSTRASRHTRAPQHEAQAQIAARTPMQTRRAHCSARLRPRSTISRCARRVAARSCARRRAGRRGCPGPHAALDRRSRSRLLAGYVPEGDIGRVRVVNAQPYRLIPIRSTRSMPASAKSIRKRPSHRKMSTSNKIAWSKSLAYDLTCVTREATRSRECRPMQRSTLEAVTARNQLTFAFAV